MKILKQTESILAAARKQDALEIFRELPYPKEKEEDWRYTEIEELKPENFEPFESETKIEITELSQELLKQGVIFTDINTALEKYPAALNYFSKSAKTGKDKFIALNASFFGNGYFLYVPKNLEIREPLRAVVHMEGRTNIIHNLVIAEQNSRLDFIEEYNGNEEEKLNVPVTEVFANTNSGVNFHHLSHFGKNTASIVNIIGSAERNALINWISGCFGGKLNRLRIDTNFNGEGSRCSNLGIFLGKGKEHIDFTTNVYHNAENTTNDILVDGILRDESSSVYRGLIRIPKEGQKTNSYLANHILKLGDKTLANSIPSLKIDANDVKASHGATVGQVDEEHLFYVMSRGLSREEAQSLIIEGFFEPIIQKIPLEELRERIRKLIKQ